MDTIVVTEQQGVKRVERTFKGLTVDNEQQVILIHYWELVTLDGEVLNERVKQYTRDFDFWLNTPLGQSIVGMVNTDLSHEDPAINYANKKK